MYFIFLRLPSDFLAALSTLYCFDPDIAVVKEITLDIFKEFFDRKSCVIHKSCDR